MQRISTNMTMMDSRFQMDRSSSHLDKIQRGISSSRSIVELRDAPVDAGHTTRLDSSINRMARYQKNIDYLQGQWSITEGYLNESVTIVQRLRELSLRGATGTFSKEDVSNMAIEVNVLLKELTSVMNAQDGTGQYIFAGDDVRNVPFALTEGRVPGLNETSIMSVTYVGSLNQSNVEINEGQSIQVNLQGNDLFWADQQQVFGAVDTEGYTVTEPNRFLLDGKEVSLEPGDSIQTIVRRINDAGAPVKASLDPVTGSLNLQSTIPHQIWLESAEGSALTDLGILVETGSARPPSNWNPDAVVSGGGLVDQIVSLRDALLDGDHEQLGGSILGGLDRGLSSLLRTLTDMGAKTNRLEIASSRMGAEAEAATDWRSKLSDLNLTEAITEMSMVEYARRAAYQVAGRILKTSLMDFLR